eukprot:g4495.t1
MSWKALAYGSEAKAAAAVTQHTNIGADGVAVHTGIGCVAGGTPVPQQHAPQAPQPTPVALASVIDLLKKSGGTGASYAWVTLDDIREKAHVNLAQRVDVAVRLREHDFVEVKMENPEAERDETEGAGSSASASAAGAATLSPAAEIELFRYKPKLELDGIDALLRHVNHSPAGVQLCEIEDAYRGVKEDCVRLVQEAKVIGVKNDENNTLVMFPRQISFLAPLSAKAWGVPGKQALYVAGQRSVAEELRRGDAIVAAGATYRVSYNTRGTKDPLAYSVSSLVELSARARYALPYSAEKGIPLSEPFKGKGAAAEGGGAGQEAERGGVPPAAAAVATAAVAAGEEKEEEVKVYKHGVSNDIRALWRQTARTDWPSDTKALHRRMKEVGIITQEEYERIIRPKKRKRGDPKVYGSKKQRYRKRKAKFTTNSHLMGTELGDQLKKAGESILRGESGR